MKLKKAMKMYPIEETTILSHDAYVLEDRYIIKGIDKWWGNSTETIEKDFQVFETVEEAVDWLIGFSPKPYLYAYNPYSNDSLLEGNGRATTNPPIVYPLWQKCPTCGFYHKTQKTGS